ncbi:MAG TPA: hypothetical protein VFY71_13215 [Planctomycetota bacterium]|nr:hypothetical protein [Planctomycetota bacterium]
MADSPVNTPRGSWPVTAGLALGLGAAPLLAAQLPLSPWMAAALLAGVLLGAGPVISGEARVARLDAQQGRSLLRSAQFATLLLPAVLSTLTAAVAALLAAWGATGLLHLALDGTAAASKDGVTAWLGAQQGFLAQPGLEGSIGLLGLLAGVLVVVALLLATRRWRHVLVGLVAVAVALGLACGVRLWLSVSAPVALFDLHPARPTSWRDWLAQVGVGLAAGLFATGAGTGAVHAAMHRIRCIGSAGRPARWLPLAVTLLGLVVLWPLQAGLMDTPATGPAPYGRATAALLLAPGAALGSVAWQAAWFAGLLAAGLAGALALAQPALHRLQTIMGLTIGQAACAVVALLVIVALPCALLPGAREGVLAVSALLVVVTAASWIASDVRSGWLRRGAAWLGLAVAPLLGLGAAWFLSGHVHDDAVLEGWLVGTILAAGLVPLWWLALLAIAALRSRALSRSAPASPAGPRTRA